ncbi:MAG: PaaI family thioesterase [Gammaproteobacteria bacterium]|nr:PaaI family thioesterase [Gammaproteobacteria bacterium]
MKVDKHYFQDYMPDKLCFGCGASNEQGLQIRSYWDGEIAKCRWQAKPCHQGWANVTCGGIIATIVDCHCIATAMATAMRNENRALGSKPDYLFATGAMNIRFLKPSAITQTIELHAHVSNIKGEKKYSLSCDIFVNNEKTAEAQLVALLAYRSDRPDEATKAFRQLV